MQTFLPLPSIEKSVKCLDYKRLGKQRVEAYQLLLGQFPNHPASKMWRGYERGLAYYGACCSLEFRARGYEDNLLPFFAKDYDCNDLPWWFGDEYFHASHRSNLLRKDYEYYCQYGWSESICHEYVWPE